MKPIHEIIAEELNVKPDYVENVIGLIDDGNTIPFIARYRKEVHGSMDDTKLRKLEERLTSLRNLIERKETVLRSIEEQGALTEAIARALDEALTMTAVEDIYRPYRQKRKTRASVAKEKGLEPLAEFLLLQGSGSPSEEALRYVDAEKGVADADEALHGAMDIIAERASDDSAIRARLRDLAWRTAELKSDRSHVVL